MIYKKPREFWIKTNAKSNAIFDQNPYLQSESKYKNFLHVREVRSDEPDWQAIAKELAEVLKTNLETHIIMGEAPASFYDDLLVRSKEALAKYESAVSEK